MSRKSLDRKGRWRSLTIAFRVSPEENEELNTRVRLSGLTKQDYLTCRCLERDVVVVGNPRVYKALKGELARILAELQRLSSNGEIDDSLAETIQLIAQTLGGMNVS